MKTTTLLKKIDHKEDDVTYTIYVESDGDVMWGTWHCHECGVGGASGRKCSDITEAIQAAKSNLQLHHAANHPQRM